MARPYRDGVELSVEPVPDARSPLTPPEAVVVTGMWYPGSPTPAPLVILPGYEYRIRRAPTGLPEHVDDDDDDDPIRTPWIIERRSIESSD